MVDTHKATRDRPLTADEASRYRQIRAQIDSEKDAILERRDAQELVAEQEPGFCGDLRRAITGARIPSHELSGQLGIDVRPLEDFRAGSATVPSDVVARLMALLGLQLTAVGQS